MIRAIAPSSAALVLCLGVSLFGQEARVPDRARLPDPKLMPQQQVFKSGVDLVTLDVTVFDGNRRPVRGLGPADFTVLENGRPQKVQLFSAVDVDEEPPPATAWLRDVAPDVRQNDDDRQRRMFLIIVDDATVVFDVYALTQIRERTKDIIRGLNSSDLASVVFTMENQKSVDFTSDRARLLKAIDTQPMSSYGAHGPGLAFTDAWYQQQTVDTLRIAVESLAALTDRRRAIIYVSSGIPLDLGVAASPATLGLDPGRSLPFSDMPGAGEVGEAGNLAHKLRLMFRAAAMGNVPVNTIDVCGLRLPVLKQPTNNPQPQYCADGFSREYLQNVASGTNGRAVVNTNDIAEGITRIFRDNSSYYLLGYQAMDPRPDGRFRRIEVNVNRPDVTVNSRRGYVPERPEVVAKRKAAAANHPLAAAMSGILPKSDLPMRLSAVPFANPGKKDASVLVMLGISQPIRETGVRTIEQVDLQVRAFNNDGKEQGATALRADVVIRAGASGLAHYEVFARMDLKPGRYQLRAAALVGSLARSGSLYYDIDVPDFTSNGVTLSGVILSATPAPPVGGVKTNIPVVPTTVRHFGAASQVAAYLRVYQRGSAPVQSVPLMITLRNQADELALDRVQEIEAARFGIERAAEVRLALPMHQLMPGQYLLTLEAPNGTGTVQRQIRFEVDR